ncbi:TolC family protein [Lutibacter sp.]|uniref:TolC family protein n=1 Tax=Lutibacter sp. TaxID=1925666 RepID=UPI001A1E54E1|nr:TolC family protein [Lutibacter sp.]MBI9039941.1 TolC family protein [Lutibacter sp.]
MRYLIVIGLLFSLNVNGQTLEEYLLIASKNNPEIKAAYTEFEVAMQKSPQVKSLPDPTLTMSAFGRMVETRVGAQEARFSIMQMFPWFGTFAAKENVANLLAEAAFQNYVDTKNEVLLNVKKMYAEIYELQQMIVLEEQNLQILDTYRILSLSKFQNGNGAMVDVVRIDIKRNESSTNIDLLKEQYKPLQIGFNSMLNVELNEPINSLDSLPLNNESMQEYTNDLFDSNPKIVILAKKEQAFEAQKLIEKKEGLPMIGIGLDYSIISKRDVPDLEMNGQDAIMPMLTVTLPIFRKKYKAAQKEVELMIKGTEFEKEALQNKLRTTYSITLFNVQKAKKLNQLYLKQIEATQQAIKLLLASYSNSGSNFEEVLMMNQDLLMLKTAVITANKNQFTAQAQLEYLLSKDN